MSEAWTTGFPHEAWLSLTAYFARAFKLGRYPIIRHDKIYCWARPHLKAAEAPEEVPRPSNWQLVCIRPALTCLIC
jgi:glucan endo-1,3-alpha-glucosidase